MSIAALHLPARRKLSFLFYNGKGRCLISIQSRPEMMAGLQLLIKCTAVVKLAGCRGFLTAVGVILLQIKVSLSLVWVRNGCNTRIPLELVLQLVLLLCLFIYSNQGAVTSCTSQHKHSGTAEWWSCQSGHSWSCDSEVWSLACAAVNCCLSKVWV